MLDCIIHYQQLVVLFVGLLGAVGHTDSVMQKVVQPSQNSMDLNKNILVSDKLRGHIEMFFQPPNLKSIGQPNHNLSSEKSLELSLCLGSNATFKDEKFERCITAELTKSRTTNRPIKSNKLLRFVIPLQGELLEDVAILNKNQQSTSTKIHWIKIPFASQAKSFIYHLKMSGYFGETLKGVLTTSCAPAFYGPRCQFSCLVPSSRHACDQVTGEVRCARGWSGGKCENEIFVSRETASMFIRRRSRRGLEEILPGNIERECREETCTWEEAREAFENTQATNEFWRVYKDPNHCVPNPCDPSHSIRCEDLIGDYKCYCKRGFEGKNCTKDNRACLGQPCQNNGTCNALSPTAFACSCVPGFRGQICSINIDECFNSNCGHYGECIDEVNSFRCKCDDGFTGSRCDKDIDECVSQPCQNSGTCSNELGFYTCQCPVGYQGKNCDQSINPCQENPCLNGGICSVTPDFKFSCSCPSDYVGIICEHSTQSVCSSFPCANNGSCYVIANGTSDQTYNCSCPPEFEGPTCNERVSPCELNKNLCPYNATCLPLDHEYICVCPTGFVGDKCQYSGTYNQTVETLRCQETSCLNNAQCFVFRNKTTCVCEAGYEGDRCQNMVDHCSQLPCMNKGVCVSVPTGFHCNCPEGFVGKVCEEDINECELEVNVCQNRGRCENRNGSFGCVCGPYHTGRFCQIRFDPCQSVPCQNGGSCYVESQTYRCECLEGFGGNQCQRIIDPCTDVTNPCMNGAPCSRDPDVPYDPVCYCLAGFYGRTCEKKVDNCAVPSNISEIINGEIVPQFEERSDCGEYGYCVSTTDGFNCTCYPGHEGDRCQTAYETPIVNCTSENCHCPLPLVKEVAFHSQNQSRLTCQYRHYADGVCKKTTCFSRSCPDFYQCEWQSECMDAYLASSSFQRNNISSFLCPVMELTLEKSALADNLTIEEFCHGLRNLSVYKQFDDVALIHCYVLDNTNNSSTIAVAVDSVSSEKQALLLAIDVYETLKLDLDNRTRGLDTNFSSSFDAIANIHFAFFTDEPSQTTRMIVTTQPQSTNQSANVGLFPYYYYIIIIIVVILILIMIVVMVWCCIKRRRSKKEFLVSFNARPSATSERTFSPHGTPSDSNHSREASLSSSQENEKDPNKAIFEDGFVNPVFRSTPTPHLDLASRPDVHKNTYVSLPYATFEPGSKKDSSKRANKEKKKVEESTVDFDLTKRSKNNGQRYEFMARISGENGSFGSNSTSATDTYDFAQDPSATPEKKRKNSSKKFSLRKSTAGNTYEEIVPKKTPAGDKYEILSPISAPKCNRGNSSPTFSLRSKSIEKGDAYSFAAEMPAIGVPSFSPPSRENSIANHNQSAETTYQIPMSLRGSTKSSETDTGGANDALFNNQYKPLSEDHSLADESATNDVYSVPRKANPTM